MSDAIERLYPTVGEAVLLAAETEAIREKMRKECLRELGEVAVLLRVSHQKLHSAIMNLPVGEPRQERIEETAMLLASVRSSLGTHLSVQW